MKDITENLYIDKQTTEPNKNAVKKGILGLNLTLYFEYLPTRIPTKYQSVTTIRLVFIFRISNKIKQL